MSKKKPEKSLDELLEEALVKENEQPYEVPGNWEWVKIGSINHRKSGNVDPRKFPSDKFELYSVPSFADSFPEILEGRKIKSSKQAIKEGDILLCKINPRINRVWMVGNNTEYRTIGSSEWIVITPSNQINNEYLLWVLRSNYFRNQLTSNVSGVGGSLTRAKPTNVALYPIPIPPLPEQKQIVKKLSSMLGKLKEAKELIQEAKETFEERRAAILNKAFTGELTKKWREKSWGIKPELMKMDGIVEEPYEIPSDWKWARLRDVCYKLQYGTSAKSMKEGKIPVVRMGNIQNGSVVWGDLVFTSDYKEIEQYSLNYNDLLFNRTNSPALVGKTAIYKGEMPAIFAGYLIRVKPHDELNPDYLNFFLNSPFAKIKCNRIKTDGVSQSNINSQKLGNFEVPLPPLLEQKEIVRILDKMLGHEDEAKALTDMEEQIDLLEKSILSKAFRGELGTNDPNDKPAIELLKKSLKEKLKAA